MGETAISVESLAAEYLRLVDEGWNPDLDEFLGRIPDDMREGCRNRIEELAALNGLDLSAQAPAAEAPPAADLGMLSQEITPDGDDASLSSAALRQAARHEGRKPKRRSRPEPEPVEEPSSAHEGIEALAAAEPAEEFATEAAPAEEPASFDLAPETYDHTETELVAEAELAPAEPPPSRASRARDEPTYIVPGKTAPAPVRPKPIKRAAPVRMAASVSEETRRDVLGRLREISHLERQGAIPAVDSDRLHVIYRRLVDGQGASEDLPVSLPRLALYAFVAAAVAGASLFVALVHDASPALQALVPGAVFLTLVGAGIRARSQGDGAGAAVFLAAGAVAAAPAVIAALAVMGIMGGTGALPAPLSDMRVLAGTVGGLALSTACLLLLRRGLFAWATAGLAAAAYGALVLVLGVSGLAAHEIALRFLPVVLLAVPGLMLESHGKVRWAMPFHLAALGALVGSLDVMAARGGLLHLLGLGTVAGPARVPYLGFAAAGLVLAILSLALERARSFDLRRGARFLQNLAAIHLVGALGWSAAVNAAGRDVLALGAASGLLMLLGRFGRRPLLLAGGVGFVLALGLVAVGGLMPAGSFALALSGAGLLGSLGIYFYLGRRGA
ncbi:MAG TPA: hypothetical protein VFY93_00465 [Planctomycetota bacterium]|nr:hypothetical protein [Planctomycetota bacterium]